MYIVPDWSLPNVEVEIDNDEKKEQKEQKENQDNEDDIDINTGSGVKDEQEQSGDVPGDAGDDTGVGLDAEAAAQRAQWVRDIKQYIAAKRIPQGVIIKGQRVRGSVCLFCI